MAFGVWELSIFPFPLLNRGGAHAAGVRVNLLSAVPHSYA
jgi:hypothetical protein